MSSDQSSKKQQNISTLQEIRTTRLEKIDQLKELGLNPYAYQWQVTSPSG